MVAFLVMPHQYTSILTLPLIPGIYFYTFSYERIYRDSAECYQMHETPFVPILYADVVLSYLDSILYNKHCILWWDVWLGKYISELYMYFQNIDNKSNPWKTAQQPLHLTLVREMKFNWEIDIRKYPTGYSIQKLDCEPICRIRLDLRIGFRLWK